MQQRLLRKHKHQWLKNTGRKDKKKKKKLNEKLMFAASNVLELHIDSLGVTIFFFSISHFLVQ